MSVDPILIVGAGPTGLVLAIELARRAVPFHLVDQRPEPLTSDRAAFVKSRSLEILATLGVADGFLDGGHVINGFDFYAGGERTASFRLVTLDSPFAYFLGISFDGHDYPLRWGVVDGRLSGWPHPEDIVALGFGNDHVGC